MRNTIESTSRKKLSQYFVQIYFYHKADEVIIINFIATL